ncbi:MAG: hypothetical protein J3Q66DRAFT_393554 [Benniella sp.]|nr:MAG: hypothetical protein J3Q66DRAFT_393554 [Benniella sp.]
MVIGSLRWTFLWIATIKFYRDNGRRLATKWRTASEDFEDFWTQVENKEPPKDQVQVAAALLKKRALRPIQEHTLKAFDAVDNKLVAQLALYLSPQDLARCLQVLRKPLWATLYRRHLDHQGIYLPIPQRRRPDDDVNDNIEKLVINAICYEAKRYSTVALNTVIGILNHSRGVVHLEIKMHTEFETASIDTCLLELIIRVYLDYSGSNNFEATLRGSISSRHQHRDSLSTLSLTFGGHGGHQHSTLIQADHS